MSAVVSECGDKFEVTMDPSHFDSELYEELCAADMCDGFPVIAPTVRRVEAMLAFSAMDADDILLSDFPPSGAAGR